MQTLDLTPTWASTAEICLIALECGTDEGKRMAKEEIRRMGRILDDQVKIQREGKGL